MIGQCYSPEGTKYNIIIMAAGMGTRMGDQSNYLPKALTPLGNQRVIDYIISRYLLVAHKFIVGVGWQADLLMNYLKGRYGSMIEFAVGKDEGKTESNGRSAMLCLDHADSRYPTIITFCDLLMMDNLEVGGDTLYLATKDTKGVIGTFRHGWDDLSHNFITYSGLRPSTGVIGTFVIENTPAFKGASYLLWDYPNVDLTKDMLGEYIAFTESEPTVKECKSLYEFGTLDDINLVRERWEEA